MTAADPLEQRVVEVVQRAIRTATGDHGVVVGPTASMDTVAGWDSLTFLSVFSAVNDAFGIHPDFDDAIHYVSVDGLVAFLRSQTSS